VSKLHSLAGFGGVRVCVAWQWVQCGLIHCPSGQKRGEEKQN